MKLRFDVPMALVDWQSAGRETKKRLVLGSALATALLWPLPAQAHCDAEDGPVATSAVRALDTGNVNLVLRYAPASAEAELTHAFELAREVRDDSPEAKGLADRYFMETAVRLHRAGEGAPYTGLRPAGTDFGPAIPAAEEALETGQIEPLLRLMSERSRRELTSASSVPAPHSSAPEEPKTAGELAGRARAGLGGARLHRLCRGDLSSHTGRRSRRGRCSRGP